MTVTEWKDATQAVQAIVTSVALVVGGGWALWRFVLQREGRAKIEFSLALNTLEVQKDRLLVEVAATVTNRGLVRHWLKDFSFDLLCLTDEDAVVEGDKRINFQVLFQPVIKKRYWIHPDWISTFIDAGVSQSYTYVASLPQNSTYALVFAKFKYPDQESEFHTAQKVFNLRGNAENASHEQVQNVGA